MAEHMLPGDMLISPVKENCSEDFEHDRQCASIASRVIRPGISLSVYRALRDLKALQAASDRQLRTISKYIVDKKYIRIERTADGTSAISVSEAGKQWSIAALMALVDRSHRRHGTGVWRSVMFDVPTHSKQSRDRFAGMLKALGFVHYQKSVFICPHPCEEELEAVAEYLGMTGLPSTSYSGK